MSFTIDVQVEFAGNNHFRHPKTSLLWFLLASNSLDLIIDVLLEFWSAVIGRSRASWVFVYADTCSGFVPPFALQRILASLADPAPGARKTAYLYTFVFFLSNLSFAQVDVLQRWHTRRCYERTRGQMFCALHYKALKRRDINGQAAQKAADGDTEEKAGADLGKIVNLMQWVTCTAMSAERVVLMCNAEATRMPWHSGFGSSQAYSSPP